MPTPILRTLTVAWVVFGFAAATAFRPTPPAQPAKSHSHRLGWSFQVPKGWRVHELARASALAPPGTQYDITRGDQGHLYAVTAFDDIADPEDPEVVLKLRRTLAHNASEPLGEPAREMVRANDRIMVVYSWSFQPRRRAAYMETRAYLVPDPASKVTLLLVAASERDLLGPFDADLVQLASSLAFAPGRKLGPSQWTDWGFEREQPPGPGMPDPGDVLADESVPSQQWFFYLRGKHIAPAPGGPAGPGRKDPRQALDLREDGTFQGVLPGKPVTTAAGVRGRWRIVTRAGVTALVLYWERAAPTYHRLERRDDVILMDDVPTSVTRPK